LKEFYPKKMIKIICLIIFLLFYNPAYPNVSNIKIISHYKIKKEYITRLEIWGIFSFIQDRWLENGEKIQIILYNSSTEEFKSLMLFLETTTEKYLFMIENKKEQQLIKDPIWIKSDIEMFKYISETPNSIGYYIPERCYIYNDFNNIKRIKIKNVIQ